MEQHKYNNNKYITNNAKQCVNFQYYNEAYFF